MALSGSRLQGNLYTAILAQLQTQFPAGSLSGADLATYSANQQKLATAISTGIAATIVSEITGHAETSSTIPATAIVTNGSPTTQSGPPSPVTISGSVS